MRRLAWGLRPSVLDDLGLAAALARYVEEFGRTRGLTIAVDAAGLGEARMPIAVETALYRIVQEALNNVVRHSRAERAVIRLARRDEGVECVIEDDGIGIKRSPGRGGKRSDGLGLRGMRERAAALGGVVEIGPAERGGTRVEVRIPVEVTHAVAGADRG